MFSVCAVVRDEEDWVKGMIESILPNLKEGEELVVFDGGSKDKTIDILNSYLKTSPKFRLVHLKQDWEKRQWKDEAAYRNASWNHCENDWVLSIDADEAYDSPVFDLIRQIIPTTEKKAFYFPTINYFKSTKKIINPFSFPDHHIRLANRKFFKWVGGIHASLWLQGALPITEQHHLAGTIPYPLHHYARVREDAMRPYGEIPKDTVEWDKENPREEEFNG